LVEFAYDCADCELDNTIRSCFFELAFVETVRAMTETFTPISAVIGGALIGLAATLLMLFNGRVAGISGILAAFLNVRGHDIGWSAAFIAGLVLTPMTASLIGYPMQPQMPDSWTIVVIAGALVGFGTRLGGGCTSGHGVCGVAPLSVRSIVATAIFMATAIIIVALSRHALGV
jgi:uncharacterized protein